MNQLQLAGQILGNVQTRFSPNGIGHAEFWFEHRSTQFEGSLSRQVFCKIRAVISGDLFKQHITQLQTGAQLVLIGFLNIRVQSNGAQEMVFYIQHIELKEQSNDQETSSNNPMA